MASINDTPEQAIPPQLKSVLDETAPVPKQDTGPVYKVVGDSKIPVTRTYGKVWRNRRDAAKKRSQVYQDAWEEAESYYFNGVMRREATDGSVSGTQGIRRRVNSINSEIENIVFANVTAMIPSLYAKNPEVEVSARKEELKDIADVAEDLVNALMERRTSPGVNLKNKVKKCVVGTLITNEMWLETGFTRKEDSSEAAVEDLNRIAEALSKAKDEHDIKDLEGELMALQDKIDFLQPSGPWVKVRHPTEVLIDPAAREDDAGDANWIMIYEYLPTAYIRAVYTTKDDKNDQYKSIYKPTHILGADDGKGLEETVNNFKLFDHSAADASRYGYTSDEEFKSACYTKVCYVWDKTTRRVLMYNDEDWTWPIWVWDDPYHYDTFFPVDRLSFYTAHNSIRSKGEISYYLDQQDAVNEINDAEARARLWVMRHLLFNTNIIKNSADLEKLLKGDDGTAVGIDLPEGMKFDDVISTLKPPAMNFPQLFNVDRKLQAIDRIASVSDIRRGAQFKTNTTNKAIEEYNSIDNQRIDERIDAIEDFIGGVGWKVLQLCLQFMDQSTVADLIDGRDAAQWQQMGYQEIQRSFSVECVGGSSQKPTSKSKKDQAVQLGQVLGQFVNAAPGPVLKLTLRIFAQAFDNEFLLDDEDWQELEQSLSQPPAAPSQPGGPPGAGQPNPQAAPTPGGSGGPPPQGAHGPVPPQIQAMLAKLPPPVQQAIQAAVQKGVPIDQAIQQVVQMAHGGGANGAPQGTA